MLTSLAFEEVGPRFVTLTTLRLEGHLLQQVLHVFLLHKVLGGGGPVAQHADCGLAAGAEQGPVLHEVRMMVVL